MPFHNKAAGDLAVAAVRSAIDRAERRIIGRTHKCLPRAIAAQWMLRRRRIAATLVIGAARHPGDERRIDFHAWVEHGGQIVVGDLKMEQFAPVLVLAPH